VDAVTWLLSRGKQRHGSAVQGNATPWYCQTADDRNDLRASPVGQRRKLLAAFTALCSDIGLVPARPPAASAIESARERYGANQFAEDHGRCRRSLVPTK
jgi:hypothetical protein